MFRHVHTGSTSLIRKDYIENKKGTLHIGADEPVQKQEITALNIYLFCGSY